MNVIMVFRQQKKHRRQQKAAQHRQPNPLRRRGKTAQLSPLRAASIQTTVVTIAKPIGGNKNNAAMTMGIKTKADIRRYFSKSDPHQA